jgi:hypothetical protein
LGKHLLLLANVGEGTVHDIAHKRILSRTA